MNSKATLTSLIPDSISYYCSKVYEGIYNPYPLAQMNFNSLKKVYESVKDELNIRYGISNLSGLADTVRRIDYILMRIETWLETNQLLSNSDAEVFMDAFSSHFDEFKTMLKELDDEAREENKD